MPAKIERIISSGDPAPNGLSAEEKDAFGDIKAFSAKGAGYRVIKGTPPQTIAYGLADSPVGLVASIYDYNGVEPSRLLTKAAVLDDITFYWLTNTAASPARLYWENGNKSNTSATVQKTEEISIPVAVTVLPGELYRSKELDLASLSQSDLLPPQGRSLRGMGRTGAFQRRTPRRVPFAPLTLR